MPRPFIHLHLHTEYSLLDGAVQIDKLMKKLQEQGAPAVAMTDHGNMYATIKFYDACKKAGIKPIIGCEMYTTEDITKKDGRSGDENKLNHLVLLAKDEEGYHNLARLNSISWIDGFYYKPRIDLNILRKYTKGLICMSACIGGKIPQLLLHGDYDGALEYARTLKELFDDGDFYIEVQDHGIPEEKQVNPLLAKIAKELGVKMVATNDVHYINKSDAEMHDVLLCVQTASYYDDPDRMRFPCDEFYLKTYDEMKEALPWCEEALDTPYEIIEKCNVDFVYNKYQLPNYQCPDGLTPEEYLRKMTYEGLTRRYGEHVPEEYVKRAEMELDVILGMGFATYYLIVWDYINYARSVDIPVGAGRGSGVGSIVAYCIGITNVEPMRYNLIFERFLNRDRTSMPDFDVDFCFFGRYDIIKYVKRRYGEDHISQIITFGKMKKKQAIKDVARAFRLSFADVSKLTKNIPESLANDKKVHIGDLLNPESICAVPELIEEYQNNETYKKVLDLAIQIENMPRHTGIHAAGVIIYKNPAIDTIPLAKNGDEITSQFDMIESEKLGLLKMDFLALMTLTDVKMAHDYVLKLHNRDIDFEKLGYEDPQVYNLLSSGNTDSVFQLEGGGMKKFMMKMRPNTMEDIIAGISIYRPGPMDNKDVYLENRQHPDQIPYKHPLLKPILDVTSGIIVYQEQAMAITRALAGYDMTSADHFRAIISKKKVHEIPAEMDKFLHGGKAKDGSEIPGCLKNGIPEETAISIFKEMESFASYAFNKSHAAAYAVLSYITAFYKLYYPVEFLAAVINNRIGKSDDTAKYMRVLKDDGIKLLQPDINLSEVQFSPETGAVRYGLSCIKGVGKAVMESTIEERNKNGKFKDLYDFVDRMHGKGVNKKTIEGLIKGGAFDCFNMNRNTLLANYENIVSLVDKNHKMNDSNQMNIFDFLEEERPEYKYITMKELPAREKLLAEKEFLGMYVTGHPLEGYEKEFEAFNFNTSMLPKKKESEGDEEEAEMPEEEDSIQEEGAPLVTDGMDISTGGLISNITIKRTKDGKEMAVMTIEDMYDKIEAVMFARTMAKCKKYLIKDSLVRVRGRLSINDEETKITISDLKPWDLKEHEDSPTDSSSTSPEDMGKILYVNITFSDEDRYERLLNVLRAYPGSCPARAQMNGKIYNLPVTVGHLDQCSRELCGLIGSENIKIK